jgi:hypothetical protein
MSGMSPCGLDRFECIFDHRRHACDADKVRGKLPYPAFNVREAQLFREAVDDPYGMTAILKYSGQIGNAKRRHHNIFFPNLTGRGLNE